MRGKGLGERGGAEFLLLVWDRGKCVILLSATVFLVFDMISLTISFLLSQFAPCRSAVILLRPPSCVHCIYLDQIPLKAYFLLVCFNKSSQLSSMNFRNKNAKKLLSSEMNVLLDLCNSKIHTF